MSRINITYSTQFFLISSSYAVCFWSILLLFGTNPWFRRDEGGGIVLSETNTLFCEGRDEDEGILSLLHNWIIDFIFKSLFNDLWLTILLISL